MIQQSQAVEEQNNQQPHLQNIIQGPFHDFNWIIEPLPEKQQKGLALGNLIFASNHQQLKNNGIGAVITVMGQKQIKFPKEIKHLRILIADSPKQNIQCFFNSSGKFIKQQMQSHNVLVHCKAGVSRSATIVAAFLIQQHSLSASKAVETLQQKRKIVYPNKGFIKQLKKYQAQRLEVKKSKQCCLI